MGKTVIAAVPYDTSAPYFTFSSGEEFAEKSKNNLNDWGGVVEEYQFDFVDGDDFDQELFELMSEMSLMTGQYFDALDALNEDDIRLLRAMQSIGGHEKDFDTVEQAEDSVQDLRDRGAYIFDGGLKDYAQETVDSMGGLKELDEQTLENHFDWDAYANELRHGEIHELDKSTVFVPPDA